MATGEFAMKPSVMISIKPKHCENIAAGRKTIEVRKSKPKLETPFKCHIYCTNNGGPIYGNDKRYVTNYVDILNEGTGEGFNKTMGLRLQTWNGKVISEFICDCIIPISITYSDPNSFIAQNEFPYTCLTDKEIMDYLGNGNQGYGWHISNLVIYDKPKDLSEFKKYNRECWYADLGLAKRDCPECQNRECFLTRPPQSWCYVEV